MNTKIFNLLVKNLQTAFNLPKYQSLVIDANTHVDQLPWTPARYRKFKDAVEAELHLPCDYVGTVRRSSKTCMVLSGPRGSTEAQEDARANRPCNSPMGKGCVSR